MRGESKEMKQEASGMLLYIPTPALPTISIPASLLRGESRGNKVEAQVKVNVWMN